MPDTLRLQVARVKDGDTIVAEAENGDTVDVRVWGVDCPETSQPYGSAATRVARGVVAGEVVTIDVMDSDHYGRIIGRVQAGNTDLAHALARRGVAWHSRRYATSSRIRALEQDARAERRGLWGQDDPTPPWEHRNGTPKQQLGSAAEGAIQFLLYFVAFLALIIGLIMWGG